METVDVDEADWWREALDPCLPHVDYFAPSLAEAAALTGESQPQPAANVLANRGARNVAIKLGDRGAYVRDTTGHCETVPAFPVENVVDTTGAAGRRHEFPPPGRRFAPRVAPRQSRPAGQRGSFPVYYEARGDSWRTDVG